MEAEWRYGERGRRRETLQMKGEGELEGKGGGELLILHEDTGDEIGVL